MSIRADGFGPAGPRPRSARVLTDVGQRGSTPLFHTNMTPYGMVQLRRDCRLDLTGRASRPKG